MRVYYDAPKPYDPTLPMLVDGKVGERIRNGLENVLHAYVAIATEQAKRTDNNPANYEISQVLLVGSGARENRMDSDLDLLLITPKLDSRSADQIKMMLAFIYFCDRQKREAVDAYVRPEDKFPERESMDISDQVRDLLDQYNGQLLPPPTAEAPKSK